MRFSVKVVFTLVIFSLLQGCALTPRYSNSLDLSQILEPVTDSAISQDKKPLVFPATIGVLMIPSQNSSMVPNSTLRLAAEDLKKELLKNKNYINGVKIISATDIKEKVTLHKLRDMYGVDILAVMSFEQDQRRIQNSYAAFFNLAILPAYTIPSVKVITSTVVDGKIVHIPSNAIIFRTSGLDERSSHLTPMSAEQDGANEESILGLKSALEQFGDNVSETLTKLDEFDFSSAVSMNDAIAQDSNNTLSTGANNWDKVDSFKKSGGGSFGISELFLLGFLLIGFYRRSTRKS